MDVKKLLEDMLVFKESIGRKRGTYEAHLRGLAVYLNEKEICGNMLSLKDDILPWCVRRDTESASGHRKRMASAREFTKYLYALDLCDGIISLNDLPSFPRYTPYVLSDEELRAVFDAVRKKKRDSKDPFAVEIVSIIYRLIHFCGLRPNEGRELLRTDYDCMNRTLYIRHNKSGRDRIIPIGLVEK